jgi:transposase
MCYNKFNKEIIISIYNFLRKEKYTSNQIRHIFKNEYKYFPNLSTIYNWIPTYNIKYSPINLLYKNYKNILITQDVEKFIIDMCKCNISVRCKHIKQKLKERFNINLTLKSIYFILHNNNLSYKNVYKKINKFTDEELKIKKENLSKKINKYKYHNIIAIDEMCTHIGETTSKSWSEKGKQYFTAVKTIKGKRYSICAAMSNKKLIHYKICEKSFNKETFNIFIKELINKVKIDKKCLFLDNATIHKNKDLMTYVTEKNINMIYNIPYMSIYNPIEFVNKMIRNRIHENKFNSVEDLYKVLNEFKNEDNIEKFKNMYNHSFNLLNNI